MDNSDFLCMHRMRLALSQVKARSWLRPGSGIPSISTAYAQARRRCAQVIHMFVHRRQGSSPVAGLAGSRGSARRCLRARPAGRMRGSGPGLDEIAPGRQPPDDRHPPSPPPSRTIRPAGPSRASDTPVRLAPRSVRGKAAARSSTTRLCFDSSDCLTAPAVISGWPIRPCSHCPRDSASPTLAGEHCDGHARAQSSARRLPCLLPPRLLPPSQRSRHKDLVRAPAVARTNAARVAAVAGRAGPGKDAPARQTESGKAPPRRDGGALPGLAAPGQPAVWLRWHRAPPAGAGHPCEGPVSRLLPRSQGRNPAVAVCNG